MPTSLFPWITGSSGAIVVLALVCFAWYKELIVVGTQHRREMRRNADIIARQQAVIDKLETANDTLEEANRQLLSQNDRLLDGSTLSNKLAEALVSVAQQPRPRRERQPHRLREAESKGVLEQAHPEEAAGGPSKPGGQ